MPESNEPSEAPYVTAHEGPLRTADSLASPSIGALTAHFIRDLGPRRGTWRNLVTQRATALHLALAEVQVEKGSWEAHVLEEIQECIHEADAIARRHSNWVRRTADSWTGSKFESALSLLDRASEGLVLIQPGPALLAQLPNLRAGVKARLKVTDPRFDLFIRILDDLERQAGLERRTDLDEARKG